MKILYVTPLVLLILLSPATAQFRDIAWIRGGHSAAVLSHAISPDGSLLATASADGTIRIWDIATANYLGAFTGHRDIVTSVAFSPDGKSIISGSLDSTVRFWDVASHQEQRVIELGDSVLALVYAPSINRLAIMQASGSWKIHDLTSNAHIATITGTSEWYSINAWSSDGTLIATGAWRDSTVKIWDVMTGSLHQTINVGRDGVSALAFSPDAATLASGVAYDSLRLWNVPTGTLDRTVGATLPLNPDELLFTSTGDSVVIMMEQRMEVWRVNSNTNVVTLVSDEIGQSQQLAYLSILPIHQYSIHPDGSHVIIAGNNSEWPMDYIPYMELRELASGSLTRRYQGHSSTIRALAFHETALLSCAGSWDGIMHWSSAGDYQGASSGGVLPNLSSDGAYSTGSIGFDDNLQYYLYHRTMWESSPSKKVGYFMHPTLPPPSWPSPGGGYVCYSYVSVYNSSEKVFLWESLTGSIIHTFDSVAERWSAGAVAFSPNAALVALLQKTQILLWNIPEGRIERTIPTTAATLAFSRNGVYLAAGSNSGIITIWDVATGALVREMSGHRGGITSLSFGKQDEVLVSASMDSTVRTWVIESGENDYTYDDYPSAQLAVAVTADGKYIASGAEDGSLIMWQARGAIAVVEPQSIIEGSSTLRCYPTPSNSLVNIECELVRPGNVEVVIVDQMGREVAQLADGELQQGIHRFTWDAEALPAGVYHCRLKTSQESVTVPIVLVH